MLLGAGGAEAEEADKAGDFSWSSHLAMIAWNAEDVELVLFCYK
jgi:hypothetical protein